MDKSKVEYIDEKFIEGNVTRDQIITEGKRVMSTIGANTSGSTSFKGYDLDIVANSREEFYSEIGEIFECAIDEVIKKLSKDEPMIGDNPVIETIRLDFDPSCEEFDLDVVVCYPTSDEFFYKKGLTELVMRENQRRMQAQKEIEDRRIFEEIQKQKEEYDKQELQRMMKRYPEAAITYANYLKGNKNA